MHVEVACLPRDATRLPQRVALVIDVIRATTTLVAMFERGCQRVLLANDVLSARAAVTEQPNALLVGEIAGLPPPDFAYGNSPVALAAVDLAGRDLIFSTSNGTKALVTVAGVAGVLGACLRNGRAATQAALELARAAAADISIVCAGRAGGTQQGFDDLICAGYLVEQLIEQTGGIAPWQPDADFAATLPRSETSTRGVELDDSARIALQLYRSVVHNPLQPQAVEIERAFRQAGAGQGLMQLGLSDDITYCTQIDTSTVVPRLARPGETTPYPLSIVALRATV